MKKYRFAIEIGGAYTKIYVKDFGIVLCEPTLVAAKATASGYEIEALGGEAKKLIGKTSENVEIFSPIINGQVSNYEYLKELLNYFFDKIEIRRKKENIIALVNCAIAQQDRTNLKNLLNAVGFREVALVPTVICSCVGAGKNISSTKTNMVINIGGANTDIAVINMNSIIKGATLGLGGKAVDVAITNAIAYNHGIVLGVGVSENLKVEIGSLYANDTLNMEVTGIDVESKMPKSYIITSNDLLPILEPFYDEIVRSADVTITSLAPEISTDIINNGVLFCGGMSNITGLDHYLKREFRYPFKILPDAENISIMGAGKLLDDCELLNKIIENF